MAKKPKALPLLFVDTNIFLNFYRARGEAGITLLERLEAVADSLILTDQIEVEFVNNRPNVIAQTLAAINAPTIPVPAYLVATRVATSIEKHQKKIRAQIKVLTERVNRLTKDPAKHDPVLRIVKKLMANKTSLNLKWASDDIHERICDKAILRYHRHFPPRKFKEDRGIGDAINWEWIIHCADAIKRDVLVITEDKDFGDEALLDCLSDEFTARTKHKAELVPKLSEALQRLDVKVTPEELTAEKNIPPPPNAGKRYTDIQMPVFGPIANSNFSILSGVHIPPRRFPSWWPDFIFRTGKRNARAHSFLEAATSAIHKDNEFRIYFPNEVVGALSDDSKAMHDILDVVKEMGLEKCSVQFEVEDSAPSPPTWL